MSRISRAQSATYIRVYVCVLALWCLRCVLTLNVWAINHSSNNIIYFIYTYVHACVYVCVYVCLCANMSAFALMGFSATRKVRHSPHMPLITNYWVMYLSYIIIITIYWLRLAFEARLICVWLACGGKAMRQKNCRQILFT